MGKSLMHRSLRNHSNDTLFPAAMLIFTPVGYFNVVHRTGEKRVIIEAHLTSDLDTLRKRYMPELSQTLSASDGDYPHQATIQRNLYFRGLERILEDLSSANPRSEAAQGIVRKQAISSSSIHVHPPDVNLKDDEKAKTVLPVAYGGVVIDEQGQVLLREPTKHFDGYVWTFAKGRANDGETPQEAARREVLEETGVVAEIKGQIPGVFSGSTTENVYFLMTTITATGRWAPDETQSIRWASPEEAKTLISQTTNLKGRQRDLEVLDAALALYPKAHFSPLSSLFREKPVRWGARGDPYLWMEMQQHLKEIPVPASEELFAGIIEELFTKLTGFPMSHGVSIHVGRYKHDGMTGGYVDPGFWREVAMPLLKRRFADARNPASQGASGSGGSTSPESSVAPTWFHALRAIFF